MYSVPLTPAVASSCPWQQLSMHSCVVDLRELGLYAHTVSLRARHLCVYV